MSFLTERYFQLLEKHNLYNMINGKKSLVYFMERHVICVWGYRVVLRSLQRDLLLNLPPINSDSSKEALRIIGEMVLDEEVDDLGDGRLWSHLELYLEAMKNLDCDLSSILSFFDAIEAKQQLQTAVKDAKFPKEVVEYAAMIVRVLQMPMHIRAVVLFYEGEPYIPDQFIDKIESFLEVLDIPTLVAYFNLHIEGLKRPGFSAAGRLIDIFCRGDYELNREAEKAAQIAMKNRIRLWNAISLGMHSQVEEETPLRFYSKRHLRLVT